MKKILLYSLVLAVSAGLGLVVGYGLRAKRTPAIAEAGEGTPDDSQTKSARAKSPAAGRAPDDSPLATKLQQDLSMSSGVTRWLYWLEAMEKATAADFPRLYRLAQGNPATSRLVSQRWIELYPRHLFATLVAADKRGDVGANQLNELKYSLFNEWAKQDPAAVIAALNEVKDFSRNGVRSTVAAAIIEQDVELGLRLFSEWHIENHGPRMNAVAKWAAADPRHAAEFALANPAGYASRLTMETIGKEWGKTDPARALEFAANNRGELGSTLAAAALKEWSGRNLNEAADWLAGTDASTRSRLSATFVETWAQQDANAALTWCESNLAGSSLAQAVGGVVRGAAEKDVAAAAALVTALNPSAARTEAAMAVGRKWFPNSLGEDKPAPAGAVAWLNSLDTDSARRVVDEIQWRWATCDVKGMAAFLAASAERFSERPYTLVAQELARKNPAVAMEWVTGLPQDYALTAGGNAFSEWRRSQPDAASQWLHQLPAADPRRLAYFQNVVRSFVWDAQGDAQLAALTGSERTIAQNVITEMKLAEDHRAKLLAALKKP